MAHLLIRTEEHGEIRFPLGDAPVYIGRSTDKDICLRDLTVSNNHAKLMPEGTGWRLRDLGSTNGTYVNGELTRDAVLRDGDVLRVGNSEMVFCSGDESDAVEASAQFSREAITRGAAADDRRLDDLFSHTVSLTLEEIESAFFERGAVSDAAIEHAQPKRSEFRNPLSVLYRLGKEANRLERLDRFVPRIAALVHEAVGGDRVFIMLIDGDSGDLVPRCYEGIPNGQRKGVSSTILQRVIARRCAILTHDALADPRFSHGESIAITRIRGVMCVPLGVKHMVYGAIYVDSLTEASTFDTDDLRLLGVIASQASVILRNIQLYEEQRRMNAELRKAKERISAWNRELERKVEERTAEIKQQAAEIQRLADLKDELLGIAAHDLRTPLTVIHGYAQMLGLSIASDMVDWQRLQEDLVVIERTAAEMTTLLNDLLDVSKIEAGRIQIRPVSTDARELLANCVRLHELLARSKGIELRIEAPEDLPRVLCDGKRVQQVLNNLVSNALKFSNRGDSVVLRLEEGEGDTIRFMVEDTGQGIDPADLPRLFSRFEQVSSKATGGEQGSGLGLAIAKKLVELHGSRIEVQSIPGTGSCFSFLLPASEDVSEISSSGRLSADGLGG